MLKIFLALIFFASFSARAQSTEGKIFDWSKHQGEKEVDHPFAEKGLIRITKDKTYIYSTERSPQKAAISVRVGMLDPVNLENPEQAGQRGATFSENYESTANPLVMVDYEWQLWRSPIGKWGATLGSGIFAAQGHGHFESAENEDKTPRENITFIGFPNTVGVVYRAQLWEKQLIIPYGQAGAIGWTFMEMRDDSKSPKFGGAPATFFAGGGAINLTYFDSLSAIRLDREYGINRIYLTAEFRKVIGLSDKFDFTSDLFNGGMLVEF